MALGLPGLTQAAGRWPASGGTRKVAAAEGGLRGGLRVSHTGLGLGGCPAGWGWGEGREAATGLVLGLRGGLRCHTLGRGARQPER